MKKGRNHSKSKALPPHVMVRTCEDSRGIGSFVFLGNVTNEKAE